MQHQLLLLHHQARQPVQQNKKVNLPTHRSNQCWIYWPHTVVSSSMRKCARAHIQALSSTCPTVLSVRPCCISRVRESIEGLGGEEAKMYRVDTILSSLGVEDKDDLEQLVSLFYEYPG